MPTSRIVPFAGELRRHGDRLAVATPDGLEVTYDQLATQVSEVATRLGTDRRLVLIAAANELDPLVTYLAAVAAGHPVLLTAPGDRYRETLMSTYDPDVVLDRADGEWRLRERRTGSAHALHPELAVLLSTSGSTGSAKLVRLSARNIQANAEAIATFLDIRDTDRASAALPMHYCYGLSVINSNLLRGAALLLTTDSVVDPRFWATFRGHGGTSLHGVPHTFDLLDRVGFDRMDLPTLRYVTQAGGALAPQRVRQLAELGGRRGWRFVVMYGQTEATARMAYLPSELATSHPHAVGVPIPGGSFEILPSDIPGQGELVYHGPNVMLGYAESAADLALGRTLDALRTGDIGRRGADGLIEVVGRTSRFVKLFGLRIDLGRVERLLADQGHTVACTGSDDALIVATESVDPAPVTETIRWHLGLPASHIRMIAVDTLPRLDTGKIDYPEIRRRAGNQPPPATTGRSVRARFAAVLGQPRIADDATFVGLGGDSLSYVQMSIEIERVLGYLPRNWPTTPVGELDRLVPRHRGRSPRVTVVETNIVLRAVAITLIMGTHIGLFTLLGGAHLLLILAGWTFARFCLADKDSGPSPGIVHSAARIALPAMLWLAWRLVQTTDVTVSNVLLIDTYLHAGAPGYWFVEAMVQTLLLFALLFAIPAARRWERRHRFAFPLACLGLALLVNQTAQDTAGFPERAMATHGVLWFFVLGWLAHRAAHPAQKLVVAAVALLMLPGYFGDPIRETIIAAGLALVVLVPHIWLPRPAVAVIGPIASASLYLYLTHYAVLDLALHHLAAPAILALCLAVGVTMSVAVQRARQMPRALIRLAHARRRRGRRPATTDSTHPASDGRPVPSPI
jgi:acyl-coenzyme A synthetase/AMP-(fatty) acid ligase